MVPFEEEVRPRPAVIQNTDTKLDCRSTVRGSERAATRKEKCVKKFQISVRFHILITGMHIFDEPISIRPVWVKR